MRTTTSFIYFKLSILKNESGACTLYGWMADGSFQLTTMSEQIDNSKWFVYCPKYHNCQFYF
jgi:hypothetical protein